MASFCSVVNFSNIDRVFLWLCGVEKSPSFSFSFIIFRIVWGVLPEYLTVSLIACKCKRKACLLPFWQNLFLRKSLFWKCLLYFVSLQSKNSRILNFHWFFEECIPHPLRHEWTWNAKQAVKIKFRVFQKCWNLAKYHYKKTTGQKKIGIPHPLRHE